MKHRYEILHNLNLGFSFITLRESHNNQRPRFDIAWPHLLQIIYTKDFRAKRQSKFIMSFRLSKCKDAISRPKPFSSFDKLYILLFPNYSEKG